MLKILLVFSILFSPIYVTSQTEDNDFVLLGWNGKNAIKVYNTGNLSVIERGDLFVGFKISNSPDTYNWFNHSGYLPCLVTEFNRDSCVVRIMTFCDSANIEGKGFIIAYSRVSIHNCSKLKPAYLDPGECNYFIKLNSMRTNLIPPGKTVNHDFAVLAGCFDEAYFWPLKKQVSEVGDWDYHFYRMKTHWDDLLERESIEEVFAEEVTRDPGMASK